DIIPYRRVGGRHENTAGGPVEQQRLHHQYAPERIVGAHGVIALSIQEMVTDQKRIVAPFPQSEEGAAGGYAFGRKQFAQPKCVKALRGNPAIYTVHLSLWIDDFNLVFAFTAIVLPKRAVGHDVERVVFFGNYAGAEPVGNLDRAVVVLMTHRVEFIDIERNVRVFVAAGRRRADVRVVFMLKSNDADGAPRHLFQSFAGSEAEKPRLNPDIVAPSVFLQVQKLRASAVDRLIFGEYHLPVCVSEDKGELVNFGKCGRKQSQISVDSETPVQHGELDNPRIGVEPVEHPQVIGLIAIGGNGPVAGIGAGLMTCVDVLSGPFGMYIVIGAVQRRVHGYQVKSAVRAFQGHVSEQFGYVLIGHVPSRDGGGRSFYGFFLAVPVEVKEHSRVRFGIV